MKGQGAEALNRALCVASRKLRYTGVGMGGDDHRGGGGGLVAHSKNYPFCMLYVSLP